MKTFQDSPDSNRSSDSHSMILREMTSPTKRQSNRDSNIDEDYEEGEDGQHMEYSAEKSLVLQDNVRANFQNFLNSEGRSAKIEEQMDLHEKFMRESLKRNEESFV